MRLRIHLYSCTCVIQLYKGEGKRAKLLPAAASFGSLVHFRLRVYSLQSTVYTFHSTFDVHYTPSLRE